jgi:hypothetical protein
MPDVAVVAGNSIDYKLGWVRGGLNKLATEAPEVCIEVKLPVAPLLRTPAELKRKFMVVELATYARI